MARSYPAAERNKTFILEILKNYLINKTDGKKKMLEIASGTGQHAAFFAENLPEILIQPSEIDETLFESISVYAEKASNKNMNKAIKIDVENGPWQVNNDLMYDYLLNINMFHITRFACTKAFFKFGSQLLKNDGLIFVYGPFAHDGVIEPESNVEFDKMLRQQNMHYGLRDIKDLKEIAKNFGIFLKHIHQLPANNKCLVFQKEKDH